jgi:hypothetical protein
MNPPPGSSCREPLANPFAYPLALILMPRSSRLDPHAFISYLNLGTLRSIGTFPSVFPSFNPSILHAMNPPAVNPPAVNPPNENHLASILLPRSSRLDPHAFISYLNLGTLRFIGTFPSVIPS